MLNRSFVVFVFLGVFFLGAIEATSTEQGYNFLAILTKSKSKEKALMSFQDRDVNSTAQVNYYIKYISKSKCTQALDFMKKYYMKEDSALPSMYRNRMNRLWKSCWRDYLHDGKSVACFKEGFSQIIGLSILHVSEGLNENRPKTPENFYRN